MNNKINDQQNLIKKYEPKNSWLHPFFEEMCEIRPSLICRSGQFYTEYRHFCERNGRFPRNTTDFYGEIRNLGFERKRTKDGYFIRGIALKNTANF